MNAKGHFTSSNFGFLAKRYPELESIGALTEHYFSDDPTFHTQTSHWQALNCRV